MLDWIKENSTAFFIALTLHVIFIGALLFNWEFDKPKKIVLKQGDIIQTTAVDANRFEAEVGKIEQQKQAEKQRKAQAERKARELKEKKRKEELRRQQETKRQAEEQKRKKAAAEKKKEEARKAALRKEKELKEKKLKEKQRKETEAKRKKEEARRKEEARKKAQQEEQRKAEEKKRQEAERKRKAEEEKQRQAELKRQQERERAERERLSKGIINRHVALISQKIERSWRQPPGSPDNLECKVEIKLLSSGNVVSVKNVGSSGDLSFDRSCETAVRKAAPLPVPKDNVIFKEFEVMILRFEPGSN